MKIKYGRTRYLRATALSFLSLFLFLAVFGLSGCGGGGGSSSVPPPTFSQMVTGIAYNVENLPTIFPYTPTNPTPSNSLYTDIEAGNPQNYYLLDVREPSDFTGMGHIPGAVNIPLQSLFCGGASAPYLTLPTNQQIIVISYAGMSQAVAGMILKMMGYNVELLRFGMSSWNQSTYGFTPPSASGDPNYTLHYTPQTVPNPAVNVYSTYPVPSSFVQQLGTDACAALNPNDYGTQAPVTNTGGAATPSAFNQYDNQYSTPTNTTGLIGIPVITADELNTEYITDGNPDNYWILDVRTNATFNNVTGAGQKGHIPGAHNIPITDIFTPQYLSMLPTNQPIVVTCYTGNWQSQVAAVLKILGYDVIELRFGMSSWAQENYLLEAKSAVPTTYPLVY
jgi:rhodanese-related sulfurtransferase